jgi:phosphatidylglycerol:prolipoprotein diacylglycerol transferase
MHPVLFTIGPFTLHSYGLMMVAAFVLATALAVRAARKLPRELAAIASDQLIDFTCLALLGGIVGGRASYVVQEWAHFARNPLEMSAIWEGGLIWYGGFLGGLLAGWLYVRAKRLDFLRVTDQFVPFLALGHAVGRLGCFLNGCCYGRPTTAWCGVVFPGRQEAVVPTQLIEFGALLVLYASLRRLQRPPVLRRRGLLFGCYLAGYATLRFLIEFLRGDQSVWWAGLTHQQGLSIAIFAVGIWLVSRATVRKA